MELLPFDCLVEIFLYAGIRAGVRALSTCNTLRESWHALDVPNKKTSELMWFKFCQKHELCPPPLDYNGYNTYRAVKEEGLDKFALPKGFTTWRDCCRSRYNKSFQCANCHYEHAGSVKVYHPGNFVPGKGYTCCSVSTKSELMAAWRAEIEKLEKQRLSNATTSAAGYYYYYRAQDISNDQASHKIDSLKRRLSFLDSENATWGCAWCYQHMHVHFLDYFYR